MVWLLLFGFLFFAWLALSYFRDGRPQPAILALGASLLLLAGAYVYYADVHLGADEPEVPAAPAPAETAAPAAPAPEPSPNLDSFYNEAGSGEEDVLPDDTLPDETPPDEAPSE